MWKLLIVDDEYIVRQGLRQSLPWDEMGIIIAGEAENASDAVKTAKEIYPDIVLCDIRLPGGEGFSVIPRIQTIVPWVQFIMITAYSDKDYMMKAIHNQVCDYLFKPAGLNEIRQAVNRAQEKILIYQEKAKQDMEHRSFLLENMEALREHAVNNLLNGDYNMQKFYQDRKLLKLSLSGPAYRLVLLKEDHSRFYDLMQRLAPLASYALTASKVSGETSLIALILNCSEQDTLTEADLNSILPGIPLKVSKLLHYLSDLPGCFRDMKSILCPEYPRTPRTGSFKQRDALRKIRESIYEAVKYHDSLTEIKKLFEKYILEAKKENLSLPELQSGFQKITETIAAMTEINCSGLDQADTPEEMIRLFSDMCDQIKISGHKEFSDISGKVLYYIRKHYSEDISLEQVAAEMFLSASYLSRCIKERTGRGFQQWLHMYRIEAAKEKLLDRGKSIDDVARECGYNSYRIFSDHFRKYTGKTASQYRNEHP